MPEHITAADPKRKHVTRGQMERLEAGERVKLNNHQLAELQDYKPDYVKITIHVSRPLISEHIVSITNLEDGRTISREQRGKLGITLRPDGTIVRTERTK